MSRNTSHKINIKGQLGYVKLEMRGHYKKLRRSTIMNESLNKTPENNANVLIEKYPVHVQDINSCFLRFHVFSISLCR